MARVRGVSVFVMRVGCVERSGDLLCRLRGEVLGGMERTRKSSGGGEAKESLSWEDTLRIHQGICLRRCRCCWCCFSLRD